MKHIWKIKRLVLAKRRKMRWYRKRSLFKNHRNCSLRTSAKGRLFRTFNSYSCNFKGGLCNRRTGYCPYRAQCPRGELQFLWFLKKWPLALSITSFLFDSSKRNLCMCLVRRIKANVYAQLWFILMLWILMCVALKTVISFFWRSVYECLVHPTLAHIVRRHNRYPPLELKEY